MRVLVTRPRADSQALVRDLEARGHTAAVEPLLDIHVRTDQPIDLTGVRTLLVTSANGVRAFAQLSESRDLRVLTVGEASAEAARAAGFDQVESAVGDADALARLAIERLDPADGTLFHAAGTVTAGTLAETLRAEGFDVRRVPLYDAVPAERFSAETREALRAGRFDCILFFSPRTAKVFVRLTYDDELAGACRGMEAVCLSRAVADAVGELPWRGVRVAERPDRDALLAALDRSPPLSQASASVRTHAATATARAATKGAMTQDRTDPKTEASPERPESDPTGNAALAVIQRFGGIRPMAHKLGVAVSTVQGWKNRGAIPESRHPEILEAAQRNGIELDRGLLRDSGDGSEPAEAGAVPAASASGPWTSGTPAQEEHAAGAEAEAASAADEARRAAADEHAVGAESEAATASASHAESAGSVGGTGGDGAHEPVAAAPPPSGPSGWLPGMFLGAALLAVGVGAAVGTRDSWLPYLDRQFKLTEGEQTEVTAPPSSELESLRTTVSDLSGQVADLEDRLAQVSEQATGGEAAEAGQAVEEVRGRIAELGSRVGDMESALSDASSRMNTLASRMENASGRMESAVQRIDSLTARVENLAGRVEEMAQAAASADTVDDLAQSLSQVQEQVANLGEAQQRLQNQGDVKEAARAAAGEVAAKTLAVAELRDALRFSAPFQEQLTAARKVIGGGELAQSLDALAPLAGQGVPTRAELANAFDRASRQAIAAAQGASQEGLLGGVIRRLNDVVTIRRVGGDAEGDDADAMLARAEAKLAAGDLSAAVTTVEGLPGPAKQEMQGWLKQARSRITAEQALAALSADLMNQLARAGGAGAQADGDGASAQAASGDNADANDGGGSE